MARIRTIKPESALSETLESTSILAALLFARLPCFTDDEGRMKYSPALIKFQVFPLRDDISRGGCELAVKELVSAGLVQIYEVDGTSYLSIPGFKEHQKVNRPQASKIPAPPTVEPEGEEPSEDSIHGAFSEHSVNSHGAFSEQEGDIEDSAGQQAIHGAFSEHSVNAHCGKGKERNRKGIGKEGKDAHDAREGPDDSGSSFALQCYSLFQNVTGLPVGVSIPSEIEECLTEQEGRYSIDEIEAMIRRKQEQWRGSSEMRQWIRPETLFSRRHFVEYMDKTLEEKGATNASVERFAEYAD